MLGRVLAIARCPSACVCAVSESVTSRCSIETVERIELVLNTETLFGHCMGKFGYLQK